MLPIPDTTALTVTKVLEERVFCYMELPEKIHTDQGAQLKSTLMKEIGSMWQNNKSQTGWWNDPTVCWATL